ncbi:MAG: efflux RND transporter periplasmic adaptor subunit [candidate division WOR-3 bacterium]
MKRMIDIAFLLIFLTEFVTFGITCGKKVKINPDIGKETICPVRKKKFTITATSPKVEYQGKRYYFCCPGCDREFMKDPEKYLKTMPSDSESSSPKSKKEILYWTCSMHPTVKSDKPGDCPICGMDLIPIYRGAAGQIRIEESVKTALKIKSAPVIRRELVKRIQIPGRVAKDDELYLAEQEYLSVYSMGGELAKSAKLRLKLLGLSDSALNPIIKSGEPDQSLIFPSSKRAWVLAEVYEPDIGLIKTGQKVSVKLVSYPEKIFSGKIQAIEPMLNPQTRSVKTRILIEKPGQELTFDTYAEVEIQIPLGEMLVIPNSAIIDTGKRKIVYLETEPNQYEARTIKTGIETDEYVAVLEGLQEGERVVVAGNFLLDSQTTLAGGQSLLYGAAKVIKAEPKPPQHQH